MRRFIEALLGSSVEALIGRFEQGITIEKHIELVKHFFYDIGKLEGWIENNSSAMAVALRAAISGIAKFCSPRLLPQRTGIGTWDQRLSLRDVMDFTGLWSAEACFRLLRDIKGKGRFETSQEIQLIQLVCPGEGIGRNGDPPWLGSELKELSKGASWKGSDREIARSRVLLVLIFCGLRSGSIRVEDATAILSAVMESLPGRDWFSSTGTIYGTSYVLRSFLALGDCPRVFSDYARDVSERLLRHVEVRRRHALRFRKESVPVDASYLLERIRFTLSILDAADLYCDARYLNAALKANDWHYGSVRRMKVPSKLTPENCVDLMIILHYIMSIANQERLWGKLLNG